jgi:ParB-like chromosome segregation protein Spo0J
MAAIYIDTIEDFLRIRGSLEPVYITSKTRGRVLVPCANTILVRVGLVVGNAYNPNSVPPDRLAALIENIVESGFCFPVVAIYDADLGVFVIVDGFHRKLVSGDEWLDFDYIPVVVLYLDMSQRLLATTRFNKARGHHQVDLDAEVIRKLVEQGLPDEEIAARLVIDLETVHRYKQITGVAELFRNAEWSGAWEVREVAD